MNEGRGKERPSECAMKSNRCLFISVLFLEAFYAPGSIDQFLFAGEVGVACRANIHMQSFRRRAGLKCIAASTADSGEKVFGMNTFFHDLFTCFQNSSAERIDYPFRKIGQPPQIRMIRKNMAQGIRILSIKEREIKLRSSQTRRSSSCGFGFE